jgi:hypothetical protein
VNTRALGGSIVGVEHENPDAEYRHTAKTRPKP